MVVPHVGWPKGLAHAPFPSTCSGFELSGSRLFPAAPGPVRQFSSFPSLSTSHAPSLFEQPTDPFHPSATYEALVLFPSYRLFGWRPSGRAIHISFLPARLAVACSEWPNPSRAGLPRNAAHEALTPGSALVSPFATPLVERSFPDQVPTSSVDYRLEVHPVHLHFPPALTRDRSSTKIDNDGGVVHPPLPGQPAPAW